MSGDDSKLTAERVSIGHGMEAIPAGACHGGRMEELVIEEGVTAIGMHAFAYCGSLKSVTLPSGLRKISKYTFGHCSALTSITIPDRVTEIEKHAFEDCTGLTKAEIGSGVKTIGENAFLKCRRLSKITIRTKELTAETVGENCFSGIPGEAVIRCPKGMKKTYRTLLTARGVPETATFR